MPVMLTMKKIITTPRRTKDLLRVRWRKKRSIKGAIAKRARFSKIIKKYVSKKSRRNTTLCQIKTAAQRPAKDICNLPFFPVRIRERQMIKLVAANVNVSIIIQNCLVTSLIFHDLFINIFHQIPQ